MTWDFLQAAEAWPMIALKAAGAYAATVLLLRSMGTRALASFNIFDLIVTVALGSLIAMIVLDTKVSVLDGAVGIATLALAKVLTAIGSRRRQGFRRWVKAKPRAVFVDGQSLPDALAETKISEGELRMAIRRAGYAEMSSVGAVILEPNGELSVLPVSTGTALDGIRGIPGAADDKDPA